MNTVKQNQHYIPQFYLRYFSINNNEKQIGLFNTERRLFIPTAKLKTQAYEPFFYGKDGVIEEELSKIEAKVAPLLYAINQSNTLPAPNSDNRLRLLHFSILMSQRNPIASDDVIESSNQLRIAVQKMTEDKINIDPQEMLSQEKAIQMVLEQLAFFVSICTDLNMKLLINETTTPFITSDNPVFKYNQFLEQRKWFGGSTGYGCVGMQMMLPIAPNKMLLIYDNDTYKVGDRRKQIISFTKGSDIDQLNCLQFLNCKRHLFFNHQCSESYLNFLLDKSAKYSKANEDETLIFPLIIPTNHGERKEQVIRQGTTDAKINLSIENISLTKKAKKHVLSKSAAQMRPRPAQILDAFSANAYNGPYHFRTTPPQT